MEAELTAIAEGRGLGGETGGCVLCSVVAARGHVRAPHDRVLASDAHFILVPTIAPLVIGHAMVVTREHSEGLWEAGAPPMPLYDRFVRSLRRFAAARGDNLLEAEHGGVSQSGRGACIVHTHIHLFPSLGDRVDLLDRFRIPRTRGRSYYWLRGTEGQCFYDASSSPSQTIRRAVADEVGLSAWDWGLPAAQDLVSDTIAYWSGLTAPGADDCTGMSSGPASA